MAQRSGYSALQIGLHWLIAVLILAAWITSDGMDDALDARSATAASPLADAPAHVWLGLSIFVLAAIRLFVRLRTGAPEPHGSALVQAGARWGHRLLYLLMFAVPLGGMLTWGAGIEGFGDVHELAGNGFMIVALGHALAAILHQALASDGTMARMAIPEDRHNDP